MAHLHRISAAFPRCEAGDEDYGLWRAVERTQVRQLGDGLCGHHVTWVCRKIKL